MVYNFSVKETPSLLFAQQSKTLPQNLIYLVRLKMCTLFGYLFSSRVIFQITAEERTFRLGRLRLLFFFFFFYSK